MARSVVAGFVLVHGAGAISRTAVVLPAVEVSGSGARRRKNWNSLGAIPTLRGVRPSGSFALLTGIQPVSRALRSFLIAGAIGRAGGGSRGGEVPCRVVRRRKNRNSLGAITTLRASRQGARF